MGVFWKGFELVKTLERLMALCGFCSAGSATRKIMCRACMKETTVCRYNWHSTGSLGWPFPMLKY